MIKHGMAQQREEETRAREKGWGARIRTRSKAALRAFSVTRYVKPAYSVERRDNSISSGSFSFANRRR